ncbi:hypothetical protein Sgleb_33920 [Streptomyces glebosus]|uniref:VanZ-like domain-containing protein n=1 Tax=Streptomyces glebosus TaxID=249580 RepID=A0A640T127_9ACTN|nr:hypothetical protein Sgleb_33920 [Streptomyces glebosus]GHG50351.1 hypothetical protein GCM10010513_08640 [Streptomyces glebosus]
MARTREGEKAAWSPVAARAPPAVRILLLVPAFAAMVAFAAVLARVTLTPSAASVPLTHPNLRPGDSIRGYLGQPHLADTVKQLGGNVVPGLPFGVLLPVLEPRARGLLRVGAATALVMLLVELVRGRSRPPEPGRGDVGPGRRRWGRAPWCVPGRATGGRPCPAAASPGRAAGRP